MTKIKVGGGASAPDGGTWPTRGVPAIADTLQGVIA